MKQLIHQNRYIVTINQFFDGVIRGCSSVDGRNQQYGAWLGTDIIKAYSETDKGNEDKILISDSHTFLQKRRANESEASE